MRRYVLASAMLLHEAQAATLVHDPCHHHLTAE
jgi:hypothetical protein